jgi:FkbM family methyltransferase
MWAAASVWLNMQEIEFHRALHRPGTLVDAGAYVGRLTVPLTHLPASQVVAFEPLPQAFVRLQQAVAAAWGGEVPPHVTLRPEALAERSGMTTISAPRINGVVQEEWASIAKDYGTLREADPRIEAVETRSVPSLRLDDAGLTDVTAIKIDVEGAELEVLHGAWATLKRWHPCLSIEIEERHRAGSTRAVPELLRELGYEGWFEFFGEWRRISSWTLPRCNVHRRRQRSSRCRTLTCSASISCPATGGGSWLASRDFPRKCRSGYATAGSR